MVATLLSGTNPLTDLGYGAMQLCGGPHEVLAPRDRHVAQRSSARPLYHIDTGDFYGRVARNPRSATSFSDDLLIIVTKIGARRVRSSGATFSPAELQSILH